MSSYCRQCNVCEYNYLDFRLNGDMQLGKICRSHALQDLEREIASRKGEAPIKITQGQGSRKNIESGGSSLKKALKKLPFYTK